MSVLFISDSSISNPILHSQGIPLLRNCSQNTMEVFFLSLEIDMDQYKTLIESFSIKGLNFVSVLQKPSFLFPSWLSNLWRQYIMAYKLIKLNNIQLIHCRSLFPGVIGYFLKLSIPHIKLIYDIRGIFIEEEIYKGHWNKNDIKIRVLTNLEKKIFLKSESIIVVSEKLRVYISQKFDTDENDPRVNVIPNCTTLLDFRKNTSQKIIGVFSGSSAKWQNPEGIKKLILSSINKNIDIKFKIITYNPSFFKNLTGDIDPNKIEIIEASSAEVNLFLTQCSFGILLRDSSDVNKVASPLKFSEYVGAGLPVLISNDLGDFSEAVGKNGIGIVMKTDEDFPEVVYKMLELLSDENIHQRCRSYAEKYLNLDDAIDKYKHIYSELISQKMLK